jgi:hypothetical protein
MENFWAYSRGDARERVGTIGSRLPEGLSADLLLTG